MASIALEQPVFLTHAKDPGGQTSDGSEFISGQEPVGRHSLGEMTDMSDMQLNRSRVEKNALMSLLLAAPPPPPPRNTPPERSKTKTTPRRRINTPVSSSATPDQSRSFENYDTWDHIKHQKSFPSVVATHSDDFTVSTIASPRHAMIADRLRAARAIYHSDTLVLDAVQEEPREHEFPAMTQIPSIQPVSSSVTAATTPTRSTPSRMSPTESDNSDSTEMMGNRSSCYEAEESVSPIRKNKTPERVKSKGKEKRPKTPMRLRLALRPKKDVETSPPKVKTKFRTKTRSETTIIDVDKSRSNAPKKGFFSTLFRTGMKISTRQVQTSSDDSTLLTELKSETTAPVLQSNSADEGKDKENSKEDTPASKPAKGAFSFGYRNALHRGRSVQYYGHDEVSTLSAPTFESLGRRSLDPESAQSIISQRTNEPSGRYLQGTGILEIETICSNGGSLDDPPEKEDSPLTMNTRRTSIDPVDDTPRIRGSEPRESRMKSLSFRDPSPKHVLRASNDPSPIEEADEIPFDFKETSPRDSVYSSPRRHVEDPGGDSPLHNVIGSKAFPPDPPLDSVEEKEDEESLLKNELSALMSGHSPPVALLPPPPPPPRPNSSCRSVYMQSPIKKSENLQRRSSRNRIDSDSPRGILRTTSDNLRWECTEPVDSDLILEQSMEDGILEFSKDNQRTTKAEKTTNLTMLTAARFNAKTMAYLHTLNGEPSPRRYWSQVCESDDDGTPRNDPVKSQGVPLLPPSNTKFAAHNAKFKSRRPLAAASISREEEIQRSTVRSRPRETTLFSVGVNILRKEREQGIDSGQFDKVAIKKKGLKKEIHSYSKKVSLEPKDPIQRAGRRLLSKSAVPIQSAARRFLAQRKAIDRMWGILEIQCYMRRWKAEATLLACRTSAVSIQRVFRGTQLRRDLQEQHEAAVAIQKVIRGYLACVSTFDTVYRIIVVQSQIRGFLVQAKMRRFEEECMDYSATKIQQWWRCVSCQRQYQYFIVDVLIIQSAFRRWRAQREYEAIMDFRRSEAAKRIQAAWRGFQSYSDYIFSLVDVIVVQRTARRWLAKRTVRQMRCVTAATQIQSQFRKFSAQYKLFLSLMNAILIQSTMRMCLAKNLLKRKRAAHCTKEIAATKIQAAWRGFAAFTDYIITHYHVLKIQSVIRGALDRKQARLRLGSIIMIQSNSRKVLVAEKVCRLQVSRISRGGRLGAMRETSAANRIQFWWRVVLDCRKEKYAALVIERFFLMVKREVDMEIARVQRKKKMEKRRRKKDKLLTLGTVDEDTTRTDFSPTSTIKSNTTSRYLASSPRSHALRQNNETIYATDTLNFTYSADGSEMSASALSHNHATKSHKASEKYASLYGIRTKKSTDSQRTNRLTAAAAVENTLSSSSSSSIEGIKFTPSGASSHDVILSPLGSPSGMIMGRRDVKHFGFDDVNPEDEFGLI